MKINENANEIIKSRYLWIEKGEKVWGDIAKRLGIYVGSITTNPNYYIEKFSEIIETGLFIPGGRILRNAGRSRGSMFNCYNVLFGDSIEEIMDGISTCGKLWKDGGGVGINFSPLRPSNTPLLSSGGASSGPLSFLYAANAVGKAIRVGGQRRAAGLALLTISHPDIIPFIYSKNIDGELEIFNLSVGITDDFVDSVRQNREWPLIWHNQIKDVIPAKKLWDLLVHGLSHNGEPGIINLDNLTVNNSYYFAPIISTNPCGEAPVEANGVCNLGSLVLPHFVSNSRFQWKLLEEIIELAITFLDYCIDCNIYTLSQIKQTAQKSRRIGLGVMGLGDILIQLGLKYGSQDALDFIERLFKFIRNISYQSSIKLSIERGSFPAFDSTLYGKAKFIRTLPASLRTDIRKHGVRNVTLMAHAPTGTISLIPECTSGVEPLMYKAYKRQDNVSTRYYIHPKYKESLESNIEFDYLVDTTDLKPIDHIETQAIIQKYTDGAVSKTILIPNNFKDETLSELLLESISDLKGITVYRDGSRKDQPVVPINKKEALSVLKTNQNLESANIAVVDCAKGGCEI